MHRVLPASAEYIFVSYTDQHLHTITIFLIFLFIQILLWLHGQELNCKSTACAHTYSCNRANINNTHECVEHKYVRAYRHKGFIQSGILKDTPKHSCKHPSISNEFARRFSFLHEPIFQSFLRNMLHGLCTNVKSHKNGWFDQNGQTGCFSLEMSRG